MFYQKVSRSFPYILSSKSVNICYLAKTFLIFFSVLYIILLKCNNFTGRELCTRWFMRCSWRRLQAFVVGEDYAVPPSDSSVTSGRVGKNTDFPSGSWCTRRSIKYYSPEKLIKIRFCFNGPTSSLIFILRQKLV